MSIENSNIPLNQAHNHPKEPTKVDPPYHIMPKTLLYSTYEGNFYGAQSVEFFCLLLPIPTQLDQEERQVLPIKEHFFCC